MSLHKNLKILTLLHLMETVDNVIDPAETRPMLIKALEMLANKRATQLPRKHGNINL